MANIINKINKKRADYGLSKYKPQVVAKLNLKKLHPVQLKVYEQIIQNNAKFYTLVGGIRSGKTFLNCQLFIQKVMACKDPNAVFGLVGHTHTAIRNVLINELQIQLGIVIRTSISDSSFVLFGKKIVLLACGQANDYQKWMGITLSGVWGTEAIQWREDNFNALIGRVSANEKFIILDTNPSHPNHWLKTKIDKNELDVYYINPKDNPFLEKEYIDRISSSYSEHDRQRWLEGQWVGAEHAPFKELRMSQGDIKPIKGTKVVMFLDLATSQSENADSTAVSVVWLGKKKGPDEYFDTLNAYGRLLKGGWADSKNIKKVCEIVKRLNVNELWIENNIETTADNTYLSYLSRENIKINIFSVRNSVNKAARISTLIPRVQQNTLNIVSSTQVAYFNELINYSADDKLIHDDAPDSLEGAVRAFYSEKDPNKFMKNYI